MAETYAISKLAVREDKSYDTSALQEVINVLMHLPTWGLQLVSLNIVNGEIFVTLSGPIPEDQNGHLAVATKPLPADSGVVTKR